MYIKNMYVLIKINYLIEYRFNCDEAFYKRIGWFNKFRIQMSLFYDYQKEMKIIRFNDIILKVNLKVN